MCRVFPTFLWEVEYRTGPHDIAGRVGSAHLCPLRKGHSSEWESRVSGSTMEAGNGAGSGIVCQCITRPGTPWTVEKIVGGATRDERDHNDGLLGFRRGAMRLPAAPSGPASGVRGGTALRHGGGRRRGPWEPGSQNRVVATRHKFKLPSSLHLQSLAAQWEGILGAVSPRPADPHPQSAICYRLSHTLEHTMLKRQNRHEMTHKIDDGPRP